MRRAAALTALLLAALPAQGAELPGPAVPVLALLAPTTGKQAAIGKRVVSLVSLALAGSRIRVVVFDTAPSARAAAERAVEAGASLVLGPVGALETEEVARTLAPTRLSMLSLSGVAGDGRAPKRMRGRTAPADELRAICERVAPIEGVRIALIAPEGAAGDEAVAAFAGCLTERGVALSRLVRFPSAQRDFGRTVAALEQGGPRLQAPEHGQAGWPEAPRAAGGMAAASGRPTVLVALATAGQGAALLPALGVKGWFDEPTPLRLFGTGSWEGPELATAASFLAHVSVVESCPWNDQRDAARDFVDRFEGAFAELPTRFDAEVYDAATMANRGRAALPAGVASPEAWAAAILAQREVDGVCGRLSWSPAGVLSHPLQLWSLDADGEMFPRASSWDD